MTLTWSEVSKGPQGCQCESQSLLQSPLESPSLLQPHLGPLPCESQPPAALTSCPDALRLCYLSFISFPPLCILYLQPLDRLIFISLLSLSSTTSLLGEAFPLLSPTSTVQCSGVQFSVPIGTAIQVSFTYLYLQYPPPPTRW